MKLHVHVVHDCYVLLAIPTHGVLRSLVLESDKCPPPGNVIGTCVFRNCYTYYSAKAEKCHRSSLVGVHGGLVTIPDRY